MRIFKITPEIEIVCESEKTRYGFRHLATLMIKGRETDSDKCCYYNRTWERYEFQSVMEKLVDKTQWLNPEQKEFCKNWLEGDRTDWSDFKMVSAVAQMGEILCDNQKEKNDWKARMIKAGLGNKGLEMPEDWDTLSEDDKTARLNGVMEIIGGH